MHTESSEPSSQKTVNDEESENEDADNAPLKPKTKKQVEDLEVKDAQLIFQAVWHELEEDVGVENLRFPAEIFWLNGSPGAGKGTQTAFIMEFRDLTEKPIIVSELLKSPEALKKLAQLFHSTGQFLNLIFSSILPRDLLVPFPIESKPILLV